MKLDKYVFHGDVSFYPRILSGNGKFALVVFESFDFDEVVKAKEALTNIFAEKK